VVPRYEEGCVAGHFLVTNGIDTAKDPENLSFQEPTIVREAFVKMTAHVETMKIDALKRRLLHSLILGGITIMLDSCHPLLKPNVDVTDLILEKRSNGYLVWFTANKQIDDIEAFMSQSNRLIITNANASVDIKKVKSAKPLGIIRKIEVEKFESSVQVSMKFSETAGRVAVFHDPETNDILVDVFTTPKN
jgi:hypothetical protein